MSAAKNFLGQNVSGEILMNPFFFSWGRDDRLKSEILARDRGASDRSTWIPLKSK